MDQKQSAQAAEDIVTQFRLGHAIGHDPTLTSELISEAMASESWDAKVEEMSSLIQSLLPVIESDSRIPGRHDDYIR